MSLLLEALKKAEKAKEEAQRRTKGESVGASSAPANAPFELQQDPPSAGAKPVLTRAQLPDISKPLEILTDDLSPKTRAPESKGPPAFTSSSTGARPAPKAQAAREAPRAAAGEDERSAAKKMFEVKFKESNPRLPFYIALGALGVFAVGTIGYFWVQLRPPSSLVNLNPPSAAQREVAVAAPVPAPSPAPVPTASPSPAPLIPGMPGAATTARPSASQTPAIPRPAAPPPAPDPAAATPVPRQGLTLRSASSSRAAPEPAPARPVPQIHPKVQAAYAAYLAGDLETARASYQEALRDDPANRDALLGLAATDVRSGRFEAAEATYMRLLRADPRDAHAQAALITLRGARQDPLVTESRLKNLLAADPGAHVLNFALGNQLAQQNRWSEAQQEYFKAFAADPGNADFAYNLAVSLDHLRQPKLALEYYQRAITLATKNGGSFDVASAKSRAAQLGGQ